MLKLEFPPPFTESFCQKQVADLEGTPPYPFAEKVRKLVFVGRGIFERSAELYRYNTLDMIKAICREMLVTKSRAHFPSAGGIFERPVKIARDNTPRH